MKHLTALLIVMSLLSCSNDETQKPETLTPLEKKAANNKLIELKGDLYTEYFPGGKVIKFQGRLDSLNQRMGLWKSYLKNGRQLSQSEYLRGVRHGISTVKHPNGSIYYVGEYVHGKQVGTWTYRHEDGTINYTKNYDEEK